MPGLASSLSPAISTQLITSVCKNKPFSKYRVSASVNELPVDHLQLLLSARSPIDANSLLLLSIILTALTWALRLPDRHSSPLQTWASVRFFDSSEISWRQPLKVWMMLKINSIHSVGACQKLKISRVTHGTISREIFSHGKVEHEWGKLKHFNYKTMHTSVSKHRITILLLLLLFGYAEVLQRWGQF